LILPPFIDRKKHLDASEGKIDFTALINEAYEVFENDFIKNSVMYEGTRVLVDKSILDCAKVGNKCSNSFCTCESCPWKGRLDIFQHLTSDEDPKIKKYLTPEYKNSKNKKGNKIKSRTPGILSPARTIRIPWLKTMIENSNDPEIQKHEKPYGRNREKITLHSKKHNYKIAFMRTTLKSGDKVIYLNSAFYKP